MSESRDLDLLRAAYEGRLPADERRGLDERLRHEPGLASMARDLESVWAAPVDPVPACELSFDDLDLDAGAPVLPRLVRHPVWLGLAASAAVLLVAFLVWRPTASTPGADDRGPVVLSAIPLDPVKGTKPNEVPAALADYAPMGPTGLRFVDGLEAGRSLARWTGRPLLVFVHYPDCPLCRGLAAGTFKAASLAAHVEPYVLAKATVDSLDASVLQGVEVGWPIFLVYGPDGRRVDAFGGAPDAAELAKALDTADAKLPAPTEPALSWADTRDAARELLAAYAAKDEGTRHKYLSRALALVKDSPMGTEARTLQAALDREARSTLLGARDEAAAGHAKEALSLLDAAVARYRSTPYERDFTAVRARLAAGRPFPTLETPR